MPSLIFKYSPHVKTQWLGELSQEIEVQAVSLELYTRLGIESYQSSATQLDFESDADCLLASIYCVDTPRYRVKMV